jgi:4-amino-4-deoxy-L-arabinose transferase-like glycosyltransferase
VTTNAKEFFMQHARGLRRWLILAWPDLLIVAGLVGLFLYANRFVDGLDSGGDAVSKWQFARQWSYDNHFRHAVWNHHMTRMGVNAVAWLGQKLCGPGWRTYYVVPMFVGAVQLPLVYALGRRISGRLCGCLAALIIIYLPAVHTSISQLLPDLFVGTYAALATYLLARFPDAAEQRKLPLLLAAAVVAFVGYLAKETFVFFYPGFGVAAWLLRRRLRDVAVFAGVQLLGLGLETAGYSLLTDYKHRLAIARAVHFAGADPSEPAELSVHGFFAIFRGLDVYWHYLLVAAAVGALALVIRNRQARITGRMIVAIVLSHIALLGISAQLWQNPLPRYMDPAIPFAALCAAYLLATCALALLALPRLVPRLRTTWPGYLARLAAPDVAVLLALAVIAALMWRTQAFQNAHPPFDGRAHGEMLARIANQTYDRNLPLVHRSRRAKTLVAFYNVYLDVRRLVRGGVLPSFEDVALRYREYTYLVKDRSVYNGKVFSELRKAGCVLELRNLKRLPRIHNCADATRHSELPAECDALLAELTQAPR